MGAFHFVAIAAVALILGLIGKALSRGFLKSAIVGVLVFSGAFYAAGGFLGVGGILLPHIGIAALVAVIAILVFGRTKKRDVVPPQPGAGKGRLPAQSLQQQFILDRDEAEDANVIRARLDE